MTNQELHLKTKSVAVRYLKIESELVALLIEMDLRRAYKDLGYASLFQYSVSELGLSEAVTSAFITVSRKAAVVPELMMALEEQTLTVSKAAKIVSALDIQSAPEIIEYASLHSTAETEKWLKEKKGLESWHTLKLSSGVMEKLKKVRSLSKTEIPLEAAFELALDEYIQKHDPLEKAKRSRKIRPEDEAGVVADTDTRAEATANTSHPVFSPMFSPALNQGFSPKFTRIPLPANIKHQVFLRDQGRCSHIIKPGLRCSHRKYLEIHHLKPINQGGGNHISSLRLLCSAHHQQLHK